MLRGPHSKLRFLPSAEFELRAAGAFEDVHDFFVEVPLRCGGAAGRDIEYEHVGEVAAALEVAGGSLDAEAWPERGFDREQIDSIVFGDRQAFRFHPFEIGIDAVARLGWFVHR